MSETSSDLLVYIAGPLFNEMEVVRNRRVRRMLVRHGYRVYLPQEDAGVSYEAIDRGESKASVRMCVFKKDVAAVAAADILVCLLDGRVPDEGTCVELGMAHALGKPCVGYKTDRRAMDERGDNNIMIDGCLWRGIARTPKELIGLLEGIGRRS